MERLRALLGLSIGLEELEKLLFRLKCEVEAEEEGVLEAEVNSDRPDMMISEGVARALKGILGIETGAPKYRYVEGGVELEVEEVPSRPYIAMAVVRGLRGSGGLVEEIIQFQEKLHATLGRGRRKIAIGIHDLSKVPTGGCVYKELPLSTKFTPLGFSREMTLEEMTRVTEQGRSYSHIALRNGRLPGIVCGGEIISVPPVINSELTRLEESTRDLLIDVTGTAHDLVEKVLEILSTTLAEGGSRVIERIKIFRRGEHLASLPRGEPRRFSLGLRRTSEILGAVVSAEEASRLLRIMRMDPLDLVGDSLEILVPPYRIDIMGEIDIIEDMGIAMGLDTVGDEPLIITGRGRLSWRSGARRTLRDLMTGLGFTEILGHVLVPEKLLADMGFNGFLRIRNPVSQDMSAARPSLLPGLLQVVSRSQHSSAPLRLFEIGDVVVREPGSPTGWVTGLRLAAAVADHEAGFEDIQAPLFSVARSLGLAPRTKRFEHFLLIPGRSARVYIDTFEAGLVGEVRPEILRMLGIRFPVACFEIDLEAVDRILTRGSGTL